MRLYSIFILFFFFFISSFVRSLSSSAPEHIFLGISPQDAKYYKSSDNISCKDGSKKFNKSQLNDDFCDCPDGTDEPGTSACPTSKFYCENAGHISQFLFSSRVNDGICDCCDGSDEYDGKVKCPNTCWEAGNVARDKLIKKIDMYKEGVTLRKLEVEKAKLAIAKDEAELTNLKSEAKVLKGLVQELKERKEQIEKVEEEARLQKEKEEKEKREAEEALEKEKAEEEGKVENENVEEEASTENKPTESIHEDVIGNVEDSSSNEYVMEDKHESASPIHKDGDEKVENEASSDISEELSREELGRIVASRWTGESTENQGGKKEDADDIHEEMPKDTHDEHSDHYPSDTDEDAGKEDDNAKYDDIDDELDENYEENYDDTTSYNYDLDDELDLSDTASYNSSWLEKIQHTVRRILKAFSLFQTPVNMSEADGVRKKYDESSGNLSKIQSRISSLTQKLKHDFGPEKEFYAFYGQCFETKQNKYVYKVCPYKQASQEEGYTTTRLGNWDKFENSYRMMVFANGDNCWNGPDRSMKVKLRCGLKNEITDVGEPSRCEYVATLSTPVVCVEDKLKEFQHKLDSMNKESPREHDEL